MINLLVCVLAVKIAITLFIWAGPLLLLPVQFFNLLGFPRPTPLIFARLLGMAYLALVVGYYFGLQQAIIGEVPVTVMAVGLTSNAGACLLLVFNGLRGTWNSWRPRWAHLYMWSSAALTGIITLMLIYCLTPP
jgi:hypothetical protein